jgi:hypothetical protein
MHYKKPNKDGARKSTATPLKEAFKELLDTYRINDKYNQASIVAFWEKLMGKTIAKRTDKIYFKGKTMFIEISSAPLKHELSLSKSKMIDLIKKEFGQGVVDDIVFL